MRNLKLHQIEKEIMSKKEMNQLKGGKAICGCACRYANNGGSNTGDNYSANDAHGLHSPGMKLVYINTINEDGSWTLGTDPVWI